MGATQFLTKAFEKGENRNEGAVRLTNLGLSSMVNADHVDFL